MDSSKKDNASSLIKGYLIHIINNTPDQAEIRDIKVCVNGWFQPRLPSLLSGQGGEAFAEAYGRDGVYGSFIVLLPTVRFWCFFGFNALCGAHFWYHKTGEDIYHYEFTPAPAPTTDKTTAFVTISICATHEENKIDKKEQ